MMLSRVKTSVSTATFSVSDLHHTDLHKIAFGRICDLFQHFQAKDAIKGYFVNFSFCLFFISGFYIFFFGCKYFLLGSYQAVDIFGFNFKPFPKVN